MTTQKNNYSKSGSKHRPVKHQDVTCLRPPEETLVKFKIEQEETERKKIIKNAMKSIIKNG